MSLFNRHDEQVTPLGVLLIVLGFIAVAVSLPHIFNKLAFLAQSDLSAGAIAILGAVLFALGGKSVLAGAGLLLRVRGALVMAVGDMAALFVYLLVGLYLALGDPEALAILAGLVLVGFSFYLMAQMAKPFKFLKR